MTDTETTAEGAAEAPFTVDIDKLLATDQVRNAFQTALERYGQAGADLTSNGVAFVIVATDACGWTGAADSNTLSLEEYQVEEAETTAG